MTIHAPITGAHTRAPFNSAPASGTGNVTSDTVGTDSEGHSTVDRLGSCIVAAEYVKSLNDAVCMYLDSYVASIERCGGLVACTGEIALSRSLLNLLDDQTDIIARLCGDLEKEALRR